MRFAICVMMLGLSGCGIVAIDKAKREYDASRGAYKACLAEHPPAQCEGQRQAMNADARNWAAMKGTPIAVEIGQ